MPFSLQYALACFFPITERWAPLSIHAPWNLVVFEYLIFRDFLKSEVAEFISNALVLYLFFFRLMIGVRRRSILLSKNPVHRWKD